MEEDISVFQVPIFTLSTDDLYFQLPLSKQKGYFSLYLNKTFQNETIDILTIPAF